MPESCNRCKEERRVTVVMEDAKERHKITLVVDCIRVFKGKSLHFL